MKKLTTEEFIAKAKKFHGDKYDYSLVNYINTRTEVDIICKKHGKFKLKPDFHISSNCGCHICSNDLKRTKIEDFIKRAKLIHKDKYDYSLVEYKNSNSKIKIICPIHGIFEQAPNSHIIKKRGCQKCCGNEKSTTENFIKRAKEVHGNKYDYSLVNYINRRIKVKIICPVHGVFEQIPQGHINRKNSCPLCKSSKGENIIKEFLVNNKIVFKQQYKFKDCKNKNFLRFDFYLPEKNICIEFDGGQHFIPVKLFGGEKGLDYIQKNDNIKTEYCAKNNIALIRIKYDENIEKILINNLF